MTDYYREGNVFTRVWHSLHSGERGMMSLPVCFHVPARGGRYDVKEYGPGGVWCQVGYGLRWYGHRVYGSRGG